MSMMKRLLGSQADDEEVIESGRLDPAQHENGDDASPNEPFISNDINNKQVNKKFRWNNGCLARWLGGSVVVHLLLHQVLSFRPPPTETCVSEDLPSPIPHPYKLYGHLHQFKTGGSNINGLLASRYEQVCGNKGYSFDASQHNARCSSYSNNHANSLDRYADGLTGVARSVNRGSPGFPLFYEIGVEDCDYVSYEGPWWYWVNTIQKLRKETQQNWKLELHVPCRDGVEHLMSQANHLGRVFQCPQDVKNRTRVEEAVNLVYWENNNRLDEKELSPHNHVDLKCFRSIPLAPYIDYMGQHLQARRIPSPYFPVSSNSDRDKAKECIWDKPELQQVVQDILIQKYAWNSFCNACMGSKNELVFE